MRTLSRGARWLCLAAVCPAAGWSVAAEEPPKPLIQGRVVSAATGAPLKHARVWLEVFSATRGVNHAPTVAGPSTMSGADGSFALEGIEPGSYLLSARRTGYLDQGYGAAEPDVIGTPLQLKPGDRLNDLTLKLTPQALLYGRVIDEDGEAVPDGSACLYGISYAGGHKQLDPRDCTTPQADGSFVIGKVAPGRYYLGAEMRNDQQDPAARDVYVQSYYPGTADPAAAAPIEVAAGAEVRGIEIRMRRARTFHIRGRAVAGVSLQLVPRDPKFVADDGREVGTGKDGRFEFTGVFPGRYMIVQDPSAAVSSMVLANEAPLTISPQQPVRPAAVEVTDSDLEDVVLPPAERADVAGTVVGGSAKARLVVNLVPTVPGRNEAAATADASGAFRIHGIFPDTYDVGVSGLAEGFYVKSIKFAGRDITREDLDLTSGAGGALEIELSPDGAEIAGTVRNANGDALPGVLVQVWPAGGGGARSAKADVGGGFRFAGLPPGDYRAVAWEELDDDLAQYAPFRERFEAQATAVKVAERGRENLELQAVPRAASAAEAAKLK